ncbi:C-type lectin domain family 5 member A-like [Tachyglossus aculeatus]|uniref:C-type lectin domain family 5 member A-like n=1 Tax=Tachyglossus aculeatus TaxID=9261 RepID=UPI0018F773C5|nr:C-type lectin domain family 5 member A-like [Tachyglossus aculeatus]
MDQNVTYAELNLVQKVQPHQANSGKEAGPIYAELKNQAPPSQSPQISSDHGNLYQELNIDDGGKSHTKPGWRFSAWAWILAGIVGVLLVSVTVTLLVKSLPNSQNQTSATSPNSTNMTNMTSWTPQTIQTTWTSQRPPTTQTSDSTPGATALTCSAEGWEAFGESCYLIPKASQDCRAEQHRCEEHLDCDQEKSWTWNGSQQECSHFGADLVTISGRLELEFLRNRTRLSGCYYFIGLKRIHDQWRWINDKPLIESRVPLVNRDSYKTSDYHCAVIGHRNVSTAPCHDKNLWICEKGAGGRSRPKSQTQAGGA